MTNKKNVKNKIVGKNGNEVLFLGCRLNAYEGHAISQMLDNNNVQDTIVINTCAVTSDAEKKSRQMVKRITAKNPDKKVIVTGCAAEINHEQFLNIESVNGVIGNAYKSDKDAYLKVISGEKHVHADIMNHYRHSKPSNISFFEGRTKAFVRVQDGCNHRCTFCIIPYGRGNSQSIMPRVVVDEIRSLVKRGYNEVVLTGVDITSYGNDIDEEWNLGKLCKVILESVSDLKRLRLSSIDVAEIDDNIYDLVASNNRLLPYFHLSLQAGDDMILKRMKRRHNVQMISDVCKKLRYLRSDISLGSDIIAGFPTETDEMFKNTYNMLEDNNIVFNHIFTYSPRPNTPASRMPQVVDGIKKERARTLIKQSKNRMNKFLKNISHNSHNVLVEDNLSGRTESYAPVKFYSKEGDIASKMQGKIVVIEKCTAEDGFLKAPIENAKYIV